MGVLNQGFYFVEQTKNVMMQRKTVLALLHFVSHT